MIELRIVTPRQLVNKVDGPYIDLIQNASLVPHIGSMIDTEHGSMLVRGLRYEYHPDNGDCRIAVYVELMTGTEVRNYKDRLN